MKRWLFGLAVLVLLSSCADFFTNSWGKNAARDPSTIKVTAGNVMSLLKEAKGDVKTSRGILSKIAEQLADKPNPVLQAAAVKAAVQASGLGTAALGALDDVDIDSTNSKAFNELLSKIQNDVKDNDLGGISKDIVSSLPVTGRPPRFTGSYIEEVSDSDLTLLALALILAESEKNGGFDSYIETWTSNSKSINSDAGLSSSEKVIAAIANESTERPGNKLGKMINDLLGA
jgi:hypothetical protein